MHTDHKSLNIWLALKLSDDVFTLFINVKILTNVGILTFLSMIQVSMIFFYVNSGLGFSIVKRS